MANKYFKREFSSLEQCPVELFGTMVVGSTGAVGAVKGGGISSITRTSTGTYTITLDQGYDNLLAFSAIFCDTPANIDAIELTETLAQQKTDIKAKTVKIGVYSTGTTLADPVQGSVLKFRITARNSQIGPWD